MKKRIRTIDQLDTTSEVKMTQKREVNSVLKTLLRWDVDLTKSFVKFVDTKFGPISKFNGILKGLEISCHGIPWLVGATVLMILVGFLRALCVNLFISLLIDIAICAVIKASTRRRRPTGNANDMYATYAMDKFSFPSGHCSRAVMLSYLLLRQYSLIFPLPLIVLAWSVSICLSRILMRRHHILDVIGGALIGWLEAWFIVTFTWLSSDTCESVMHFFFR